MGRLDQRRPPHVAGRAPGGTPKAEPGADAGPAAPRSGAAGSPSGAKSDQGDAHLLAEIVRLDRAHHRPVAGDTEIAEHIKVAARAHQTMIWSRVRQVNTLRSMLREYYPGRSGRFWR